MSNIINSKQLLPLAINTTIWKEFFDCWDEELMLLKEEIDKKKSLFVVETIEDERALIQLMRDFGYAPNRVLDDSLEFLKKETKTLLFKVKNRTTYQIYEYFFNLIGVKGRVFNYFYDGVKLVESVDLEATLTKLSQDYQDWTVMFDAIVPILNLNLFLNKQKTLDEPEEEFNLDLDQGNTWYLDQDVVVFSTRHLSIDFLPNGLLEKDGEDYLFLKEYSMFYNDIAQYNRKCVEVPHVGLLLSFVMDNSGVYNIHNSNGNKEYTIPDLKMSYATTSATSRYVPSFLLSLDTDDELNPGQLEMDLNKDVTWFLDNESEPPEDESIFDRFAYICAGTGSKRMLGIEYFDELGDNSRILGFWDFDSNTNNSDRTFPDFSNNNRNLVIYNDNFEIIKDGIIGKSLNLLGIDSYGLVEDFVNDSELFSMSFWLNINSVQNSSEVHIIDFTTFKVSYFESSNILRVQLNDGVNTVNCETNISAYLDNDILLSASVDNDTDNNLKLYINGILIDTFDITSILSIVGSSFLYIGCRSDISNFYNGYIDEIRAYKNLVSEEAFLYLYDNRVANSTSGLENEIFCEPISQGELIERSNLYFINTIVKTNHVKNQRAFRVVDVNIETYTGILDTPVPIQRNTFELVYQSSDGSHIAIDDGGGNLNSKTGIGSMSGTINYLTGEYSLTFFKPITEINYSVGTNVEDITFTLPNKPIEEGSVTIEYTVSGTRFTATDNGSGGFSSAGLIGSSINYITGDIMLDFNGVATDIIVTKYTYKNQSIPSINTIVNVNYKIDDIVPITEVGIKNNRGDLVAYATFPKVEMLNNDHISTGWFIYK